MNVSHISLAIRQRNAALQEEDPDEALIAGGYVAPPEADVDEQEDDVLPPSDVDEPDELPVASSDPIEYDDTSDGIVSIEVALRSVVLTSLLQLLSSDADPFTTPQRPRKRAARDDGDDRDDGRGAAKKGKVTSSMISPASLRLGVKGKKALVVELATEAPYPGILERVGQVESTMEKIVNQPDADSEDKATWARLVKNPAKMQLLVQYVSFVLSIPSSVLILSGHVFSFCLLQLPHHHCSPPHCRPWYSRLNAACRNS